MMRPRHVAAVGGGHGLARTLEALLHLGIEPDAIVTVADDGGSSGRLRQSHGVMALGDMRMALQTLGEPAALADLFGHRFAEGELHGHALGNLVLLALIERAGGDVLSAVQAAASLLGCRGRVLPCTTQDVTLVADINGREVEGQVAIATTAGRHRSVWLEPRDPDVCQVAVDAIGGADAIVLGPGSLYTSIIPNLLVPGIREAIAESVAPLLYVANLSSQPGETAGMDLQDHVEALLGYVPEGRVITVIAHDGLVTDATGKPLAPRVAHRQVDVLDRSDLATSRPDGVTVAAHDTKRLAQALERLLPAPSGC